MSGKHVNDQEFLLRIVHEPFLDVGHHLVYFTERGVVVKDIQSLIVLRARDCLIVLP